MIAEWSRQTFLPHSHLLKFQVGSVSPPGLVQQCIQQNAIMRWFAFHSFVACFFTVPHELLTRWAAKREFELHIKMIERLTFITPISPRDCIRRLEKLADKKHFHFSSGNFILHIKVNSIETGQDYFHLLVLCSPQRFKLPAFVFFRLNGQIQQSENGTLIRIWLRLAKPFSLAEWGYLIFWLLILGLAVFGSITAALSSNLLQGLLIGLAFVGASLGYTWILYQTYKSGMVKIPHLVCQALCKDLPAKSPGHDSKPPDWVSS